MQTREGLKWSSFLRRFLLRQFAIARVFALKKAGTESPIRRGEHVQKLKIILNN